MTDKMTRKEKNSEFLQSFMTEGLNTYIASSSAFFARTFLP